jgi:hypothetical protein
MTEEEILEAANLTLEELRSASFVKIIENRQKAEANYI